MQQLDIIENKIAAVELIENLDKKIPNMDLGLELLWKILKEKERIDNEKIDLDSARIGKLEDIITN